MPCPRGHKDFFDMLAYLRKAIARLGGADLAVLLTCLVIVTSLWSFITLAYVVSQGSVQQLDERLIRSLRNPSDPAVPLGPKWLGEIGRDLTALGGIAALCLVTAAVAGYLLMIGKY